MTPEFERHLRQYMKQRKLPRKTGAIREAVERGSEAAEYDFRSWLGMGCGRLESEAAISQRGRFAVVDTSNPAGGDVQ